MTDLGSIQHVADTSLWVAVHRASEGDRPDAMYKDPYARTLAGERGALIAKKMAAPKFMAWMMAMRTVGIDQLIEEAVDLGVDTILNLGAGLDTRPYRLNFKRPLKWIEVDFPAIIDLKNEKLKGIAANVSLERVSVDLSQRLAAQNLFKEIGNQSKQVLVITEGVIPYLSDSQAEILAQDLFSNSAFKYWIQDYRRGGYGGAVIPSWIRRRMKAAPFKFSQVDWFGFFESHGWTLKRDIRLAEIAEQRGRPFPIEFPLSFFVLFMPKIEREKMRYASGVAMLERL